MLVQIAIIALGILLGYLILASRGSHGARASVKVGLVLLVIVMIIAVLNPELMTRIAHLAGIGRGADLLLYTVTGAFLFYTLTQYLKSQSQRDLIFRLARRVALIEANGRYAEVLVGLDEREGAGKRPTALDPRLQGIAPEGPQAPQQPVEKRPAIAPADGSDGQSRGVS